MTKNQLPNNIFRISQNRFDAIPGSPLVYWISEHIRQLFIDCPRLGEFAKPWVGLQTSDNFRFLRYWWEVGVQKVKFGCADSNIASSSGMKWFPYMKGGGCQKWYGLQYYVINYKNDGYELKEWADPLYGNSGWSRIIKSTEYYFREGITYSKLSTLSFSARHSPGGFIFDVAGTSLFPQNILIILAILNSTILSYLLRINPTVNFQAGDLAILPLPITDSKETLDIERMVHKTILITKQQTRYYENSFDFAIPPSWGIKHREIDEFQQQLTSLESQIDNGVFRLYKILDEDKRKIKAELENESFSEDENDTPPNTNDNESISSLSLNEHAVYWISFAIGIIQGRFFPGDMGRLGSGTFRITDSVIGSLPVPTETEFNELVGPSERFAYVDKTGGRHVFSKEVEEKLCALADTDGIAPLDEGHPDDLPAKVETALELMLGEQGAAEVIAAATGESHDLSKALRRYLERRFFSQWHVKQYRSRPVYWLLQSPQRLYGLYLFHERLTHDTLFVIQRQYVDRKINLTRQQLAEQRARAEKAATARERRELDKQAEDLERLLLDVEEFARRLKAITDRGYTPHIDDGVILNMAPLWEVIPSWSKEPKKYWDGLMNGEYDWAHMALDYRPDQVRARCRTDKSLAIAHGHEEWYEG